MGPAQHGVYQPGDPLSGERAAGDASSGEQQLRQPVSGHHAVGGDWFGCRPLAIGLFVPGVALQLAYAAAKRWAMAGNHPREATTPGLYLPTVANNFISAMACGALGFSDAGLVFLGAGVFSG